MLALNGTPLLILLIFLALLLVGGTAWGWPRLSRQSVLTVFSRIVLICVTQFVVLSMVAVMVNDDFEFYTSWTDLMGTVQGGGTVAAQPAGDTTQSAEVIAIGKPGTGGLGGSDPAKVGQLRTVKVEGAVSGLSEEAVIYLPPQYFQAPYKTAQFPAVIASSGYPGSASEVATKFHLPNLLLAAAKVGDPNYQPTLQFMATVKGRMQVSTLFAADGGHNLTSWIAQFPAVLDWLGLHLVGPVPTPSG